MAARQWMESTMITVSETLGGDWTESMREWDATMAEYDKEMPSLHDARVRLYTLFMDFDPVVTREYRPMKDAWSYDIYIKFHGRKIRISADAPNIAHTEAAIDPDALLDEVKRLWLSYLRSPK